MKKLMLSISALALSCLQMNAQVTPVNPSSFAGHYYTEKVMKIDGKKSDELDMTFDEQKGLFEGRSPKKADFKTLKFFVNEYKMKWVTDTKIWVFENGNMNGTYYGDEMFISRNDMAVFIEEGVLVVFAGNFKMDEATKTKKWILYTENPITLMAKDKSKLTMDKKVAADKAIEMLNAASGAQLNKAYKEQVSAALAVPDETISKTDKELKKEISDLLKSYNSPEIADFLCAYTTSNDWTIITNKSTGAILSREINAEMICKGKTSGNCWRYPYTLSAQYNGSGFGKLTFLKKWNEAKCDCSQVDKNK